MSKKIVYHTVILQDFVFEEIHRLQEELSQRDGKFWSISNVINLLLGFCFEEKHDPNYIQKISFLKNYLMEKELFLNTFVSNVLISSMPFNY
jgi:uncharacterized membrane-anchored protein YjiN (DUF445 family)